MKLIGTLYYKLVSSRIFHYLFIGFLTTAISFGTFWLLYFYAAVPPNVANIISVFLAVIFAYVANKIVVFKSSFANIKVLLPEVLRFILSRGLSVTFEIAGVYLFIEILNLEALLSKALISLFILILNYLMFRFYVFRGQLPHH